MNVNFPFWQGLKKLLVDREDGTHAERVEAYPPVKLMTDEDGPYSRLRVDVGQTSFFAGREFMALHEYSIAQGATIAIRAIATVDVFLQSFVIDNWTGSVRLELKSGSTVTSPFINDIPVMRTNNTAGIDSSYTTHVDMDNGGVVTGGTILDVFQVVSGNKNESVSGGSENPVGMAAGTYYMVITNNGNQTATGVFKARWEERP